ncbi:MAG: hypothetical protein U0905_14210 [Pirellulales bacterium]
MALDQYSFCPCGSGKKIKFCKCADNLQEMTKVERMMDGEQNVAALDRINQLLKTFPNDAWLHAMKCDLLLRLREIETLEEASAKFIRLQPENPLAQMYRSFLAIMRGNLEEAAVLFWQGISNTGESYHPMVLTVAVNLLTFLARTNRCLPALLQCEYLMDCLGDHESLERIYESILAMDSVSVLARESIPSPSEPENAPWLERFREAYALLSKSRLSQAKTKLEALQREFGPAPEILITLLHCKLLLVDIEGAASICGKLAESNMLPEPQRIYFQALQFDLAPKVSGLEVEDEVCQYVLENESEAEEKIISNRNLIPLNSDQLKQISMAILKEEVPPKFIYGFATPIFEGKYGEANPRLVGGWIAVFGKQTDKPARLVIAESMVGLHKDGPEMLRKELGLKGREVVEKIPSPYTTHISTQVALNQPIENDKQSDFETELKGLAVQGMMSFPFRCLDGKTISEVGGQSAYQQKVQALLLHWESTGVTMLDSRDYAGIYSTQGLAQPKVSAKDDTFDLVGGASYFWIDLNDIDPESLIQLMQSAMNRRVSVVFGELVAKSKSMQWPAELATAARYTTLNMEVRVVRDPTEAEVILEQIYEAGKQLQLPVGNAVLERVEVLAQLGRQNDASLFLQKAFREVPQDPYLLQYLQMMRYEMQQRQMQAAGGEDLGNALMRHGATKAAPSSGLWTPDGAAPESSSSQSGGGGSKLWLPGQ